MVGKTTLILLYSNTTLVKVKWCKIKIVENINLNSNTTLVKVKWITLLLQFSLILNSNTTLVKVKYDEMARMKEKN